MDKDFMQYVYARIEQALTENSEYKKLQKKCAELSYEDKEYEDAFSWLDAKAQELCYIQGFKDAMALLVKSL